MPYECLLDHLYVVCGDGCPTAGPLHSSAVPVRFTTGHSSLTIVDILHHGKQFFSSLPSHQQCYSNSLFQFTCWLLSVVMDAPQQALSTHQLSLSGLLQGIPHLLLLTFFIMANSFYQSISGLFNAVLCCPWEPMFPWWSVSYKRCVLLSVWMWQVLPCYHNHGFRRPHDMVCFCVLHTLITYQNFILKVNLSVIFKGWAVCRSCAIWWQWMSRKVDIVLFIPCGMFPLLPQTITLTILPTLDIEIVISNSWMWHFVHTSPI